MTKEKKKTKKKVVSKQPIIQLMPQSPEDKRILRERADSLAQKETSAIDKSTWEPFICFRLGTSELYGIAHRYAEAVIRFTRITRVPSTPAAIAGVINRHSELLTVLDMKQLFNVEGNVPSQEARVIIASFAGTTVGILVDAVLGEDYYQASNLGTALPSDGISNLAYVEGIHKGRITLINMQRLLEDPALIVNANSS